MISNEVLKDMLDDAEKEVELLTEIKSESDKTLSEVLLRIIALEQFVSDVKKITVEAMNKLAIMNQNRKFDNKENDA